MKGAAFQPRVIKQNRGSAGEGIWLVWLQGKEYCKNLVGPGIYCSPLHPTNFQPCSLL